MLLLSAVLITAVASSVVAAASVKSTPGPRTGGNLNILVINLSWASTDPIQPVGTSATLDGTQLSYQNLFTFNTKSQIEPLLATGFSYNANHTVLTITLRKGVKFQDGTPFNASAVAYNLNRVAAPASKSECVPFFSTVSSIHPVSTYTVAIDFSTPYSALPDILGSEACAYMASPTATQQAGLGLRRASSRNEPVDL